MNSLVIWKEICDLSFELAETVEVLFDSVLDYCKKHDIPLHKEKGMWNLIKRALCISEQIAEISSSDFKSLKLPSYFFKDKDPEELPESLFVLQGKYSVSLTFSVNSFSISARF